MRRKGADDALQEDGRALPPNYRGDAALVRFAVRGCGVALGVLVRGMLLFFPKVNRYLFSGACYCFFPQS